MIECDECYIIRNYSANIINPNARVYVVTENNDIAELHPRPAVYRLELQEPDEIDSRLCYLPVCIIGKRYGDIVEYTKTNCGNKSITVFYKVIDNLYYAKSEQRREESGGLIYQQVFRDMPGLTKTEVIKKLIDRDTSY